MFDLVILIVVALLAAFLGIYALGGAVRALHRDVLGIESKTGEWLDRHFGTGFGLESSRWFGNTRSRFTAFVIAMILAALAYVCIRYGVVEPIAMLVADG